MSEGWLEAVAHAPVLAGQVEIVGLADLREDAARARAGEFGLDVPTGADLPALLAETRPDMLFDVVPPEARKGVVLAGLAHGCHVLSEKPMATSLADAREMIAAAGAAGRTHAVIQNRRYVAGAQRARALVASGVLGELTAVHCDFFLAPHFGGFREQMDHVLLLDMAIHTFDQARFMAGIEPRAVYAQETNPKGSWYAHGAAANAIFEMSGEVVFTYRGSWCAEGAPTSWESAWRFIGTRGTLLWDGAERFDARVVASEGKFLNDLRPVPVPRAADADRLHGHASVIAGFLAAIAGGRAPETAGADNIRSLAMVLGAIDSAAARARVEIEI